MQNDKRKTQNDFIRHVQFIVPYDEYLDKLEFEDVTIPSGSGA